MRSFSDFTSLVNEMMDEFGSDAILITKLDGGAYDPATAKKSVVMGQITIKCIFMDLTLQSNGEGTRERSLIKAGDKVLYVRPSDELLPILMPDGILAVDSSDDKVIVGGHTYDIVTTKVVDPTASGTSPILFELYLRR